MSDEQNNDESQFQNICDAVVKNIRSDREGLKSIIDQLKDKSSDIPELIPMFAEVSVKAYDTLNKLNSQLVSIAALYRKKKGADKDMNDDLYNQIGDSFAGDSH